MNNMAKNSKGILFKGDLVHALLKDRKNQTRRLIPDALRYHHWQHAQPTLPYFASEFPGADGNSWLMQYEKGPIQDNLFQPISCRYGGVGDKLFVKETFQKLSDGFEDFYIYRQGYKGSMTEVLYPGIKWKSSMFMPRVASRITLEITATRLERLQDITEVDANGEGCHSDVVGPDAITAFDVDNGGELLYARDEFADLWNSIASEPKPVIERWRPRPKRRYEDIITHYISYPWEDVVEVREHKGLPWFVFGNPWVQVINFKKL